MPNVSGAPPADEPLAGGRECGARVRDGVAAGKPEPVSVPRAMTSAPLGAVHWPGGIMRGTIPLGASRTSIPAQAKGRAQRPA